MSNIILFYHDCMAVYFPIDEVKVLVNFLKNGKNLLKKVSGVD